MYGLKLFRFVHKFLDNSDLIIKGKQRNLFKTFIELF